MQRHVAICRAFDVSGNEQRVDIEQAGRSWYLRHNGEQYICHPSVRSLDSACREILFKIGLAGPKVLAVSRDYAATHPFCG